MFTLYRQASTSAWDAVYSQSKSLARFLDCIERRAEAHLLYFLFVHAFTSHRCYKNLAFSFVWYCMFCLQNWNLVWARLWCLQSPGYVGPLFLDVERLPANKLHFHLDSDDCSSIIPRKSSFWRLFETDDWCSPTVLWDWIRQFISRLTGDMQIDVIRIGQSRV